MLRRWLSSLLICMILAPVLALAQVQPVKPVGSTLAPLLPNAFASAENIAAQTTTAIHGLGYMWDGATWDRLQGNSTDGLLVNLGANNDVTITGSVTVTDGAGALNVIVDSGSITANAGTNLNTSALLLDATYTGRMPAGASPADNESNTNAALSRIGAFNYVFDGTTWDRWTGAVTQSGTWNITNVSGTVSLPTGASTLTEQQTQTTALQLIDNIVSGTGANISQFGGANVVTGTGVSGVGIPRVTVSSDSTVTANAGTNLNTSALALDATLTGGTQKAIVRGGAKGSTTAADVTSTSSGANRNILDVAIYDAAGSQITTFGGGSSTPSDAFANPTTASLGMAFMMGWNGSTWDRISDDSIGSFKYLKTSMVQDIELSAGNGSTANLAAGATFTGTSQTTLGSGSIQVNLFSDQPMSVQVQQAQEDPGTNWNIIDSWTYTANSTGQDAARTVQATGASVRVVVTNTGSATSTILRLATALCPVCDSLPRGLTQLGNLRTALVEPLADRYGQAVGTQQNPFIVAPAPSAMAIKLGGFPLAVQPISITAGPFSTAIGVSGDRLKVDQTPSQDWCDGRRKTDVAISQTASTKLITGIPTGSIYVCSIRVVAAAAEIVSIWEGTGTACGTGTIAHSGSTTAANGESLAANGGFAYGNGGASVVSLVPGVDFCLAQNGANRVSGMVSYVYGP